MPTFPLPTNPVRVTWPDVIAAVQAFLNKYTGVQLDHVICGNYNRAALPNTDEIVLYYPLRYERHGTNIETFDAAVLRLAVALPVPDACGSRVSSRLLQRKRRKRDATGAGS